MPTWSDKLLGEVVRLLLDAYYEPVFSDRSHGFRPGRGCHTALRDVADTWTGTTWFIEGDIADCFGSLDHEIMIRILAEKIHDNRFLRLMRNMLRAGYLEDWVWNATLSGAPQGGCVSPVLSNIYLDKLDNFVGNMLIPEYTRGETRTPNQEYERVRHAYRRARKSGNHEKARELRRKQAFLPSVDCDDPGYRRLHYARYADDTLFGFTGPKAEAEEIKQRLTTFLRDELHLELSAEKTLITHARTRRREIPRIRDHHPAQRHQRPEENQRQHSAARAHRGDQGQMRTLPGTRQTRRPQSPAEPRRLRHRRGLRGEIPGHQPVLPARRRRPQTEPAAVGHGDLAAQDARGQARLDGDENGGPLQGRHRDPARAAHLLRGRPHPRGQPEAPGRTVRRHSPQTAENRSHRRPRSRPGTPTPARRSSPGSSGTGANCASTAARCRCTTSPGLPTSHTPATASQYGPGSWQQNGASPSWSARPATTRSMPNGHQPQTHSRRKSLESRMPGNWHVRFGGGPYGKGPANCGHLAVRPTQPSLHRIPGTADDHSVRYHQCPSSRLARQLVE